MFPRGTFRFVPSTRNVLQPRLCRLTLSYDLSFSSVITFSERPSLITQALSLPLPCLFRHCLRYKLAVIYYILSPPPPPRASLVAQLVKNPPAMRVTWVRSLGWERSPGEEKDYPLQYSGLENSMDCSVHGVAKSQTRLSDFHFHFPHHLENSIRAGTLSVVVTTVLPVPRIVPCTWMVLNKG